MSAANCIHTSAGFICSGERFRYWFRDFAERYGIEDMYSGGFYPFPDEGWYRAPAAYADYLRRHEGRHVLFLEIGVGGNTPVIIKYPFWQMTDENSKAVYCCLNRDEACCPKRSEARSVCLDGDTGALLALL